MTHKKVALKMTTCACVYLGSLLQYACVYVKGLQMLKLFLHLVI